MLALRPALRRGASASLAALLLLCAGCAEDEASQPFLPGAHQPDLGSPGDLAGVEDLESAADLAADPEPDLATDPEADLGTVPGCVPSAALGPDPVRLRWDPAGDFFALPFPEDLRLDESGHPRLSGFPDPTRNALLQQILGLIETQTPGWALNGAIYLSFDGPLTAGSLPPDPAATLAAESPVQLVELDAEGRPGARVPLQLRYQDSASLFLPAHTLIARPVPGFVPRGGRRHALLLKAGLLDAACRPLGAPPDAARAHAEALGLQDAGPLGLAVFTPQDVVGPMQRVREAVEALPAPQVLHIELSGSNDYVDLYQGEVEIPNFQAGEPPYLAAGSGGDFVWDEDGRPLLQRWEPVRFSLAVPHAGEAPAAGWPVMIYSHGTGGDYESVLNGPAQEMAVRGVASLGFDQVLHGTRDPTGAPPELTFFNVLNMPAGRDNVRQGGVDGLAMLRLVRSYSIPAELSAGGAPVTFDGRSVLFAGHSQGGITGAPFVAVAEGLAAALFSGTSGLLGITVLERQDLEFEIVPGATTYKELVEHLLGIRGQEELDLFHPVLTLLQTFIEPADTVNYAPAFHREREAEARTPILVLEGFLDPYSPANGIEAFALAAGCDLVEPVGRELAGLALLGRAPLDPPVEANWDGVTAALSQYPNSGHFPLFELPQCKARAYGFLRSALDQEQPTVR